MSLLQRDTPYLLGISGGRDSVFLLHWLLERNITQLTLCHLHHGLRGEEADRDAAFVRELGTSLDLPVMIDQEDVAAFSQRESLSLETAARQARHHFFERCAEKTGHCKVLLAHHADDQVETILFRLLRGSAGLKGMHSQLQIANLTFLRPLLHLRRSVITGYLKEQDLPFCEDSSNSEAFATRNRLRNEALPLLAEIMALDPSQAILRAVRHHEELKDLIATQLSSYELLDPQQRLFLPILRTLHPALQRQALYSFLKNNGIADLSASLLDSALELLASDGPPSINLPGGLRLRRKESRVFISS